MSKGYRLGQLWIQKCPTGGISPFFAFLEGDGLTHTTSAFLCEKFASATNPLHPGGRYVSMQEFYFLQANMSNISPYVLT